MPELDHDVVAGLYRVGDFLEAAFAGVGAGAAAADGFVGDGVGGGGGDVFAPAWSVSTLIVLREGRVTVGP